MSDELQDNSDNEKVLREAIQHRKRKAQSSFAAPPGSATPVNSPCMDGEGFVSHDVSLIETNRGPHWKCRKCGRVLE